MKRIRAPKYVVAGVVGLVGLGVGAALGPAAATAATGTSTPSAVSGRVSAIKDALSGLVKDKTLTQAQADQVATTLGDKLPKGGSGWSGSGWRGGGWGGHGAGLDAAAKVIGVSTDDLRTALQGGKTLAQVASGKGIDQTTLVSKLLAAEKAKIAADVTAGTITQAQADAMTADLQARITTQVTSTRPAGGQGHHGWGSWGMPGSSPSASAPS